MRYPGERQLLWHSVCCHYMAPRNMQLSFHCDGLGPYAMGLKITLLLDIYRQMHK